VAVALQRAQASTILRWVVVVVDKAFSRLGPLLGFPALSLFH